MVSKRCVAKKSTTNPKVNITNGERNIAFLSHLAGLLLYILPGFNILIPLLTLLREKKEDSFILHHSRQAFYFQLIMTTVILISLLIPFFYVFTIIHIIFTIIGSFAAYYGKLYTYPLLSDFPESFKRLFRY